MTLNKVLLRETSSIIPGPIQPQFLFHNELHPPSYYRIDFRHPAYPERSNILLSLPACEQDGGGLHYGLAHSACAIIANNRFDGYLSTECKGLSRIEAEWDDCLPPNSHGYYFHVPPHTENHNQSPYCWPLVPSFLDWQFPHQLPKLWQSLCDTQSIPASTPQSDLTRAVRTRDARCIVSGHITGTEVAHIIPAHEKSWFKINHMSRYNSNGMPDEASLLRDVSNAMLLRADIHKAFDDRKLFLFPKDNHGFVVHILHAAPDLRLLYHNARVSVPSCEVNFLFARFAWSIFPLLFDFLTSTQKPRLVVRWDEVVEDWIESEIPSMFLAQKSIASRSNSPTKRSRMASSVDESDGVPIEADHPRKRCRREDITSFVDSKSSFSTIVTEDGEAREIEELRQAALAKQRPHGYSLPTYRSDRDAREELELIGVEVIDDLSDDGVLFTKRADIK